MAVVDETLLTHVMDDLARGVIRAQALAPVFFDQVFKDFAKHFGVNGDFLFQRLGLVDREVVAVEHVEHAGARNAFLDELGVSEQLVG